MHRHICTFSSMIVLAVFTFAFGLTSQGLCAQELDSQQAQKLASAKSALKQLKTNLDLAKSSAGSGVPKGSRAKLAMVRLGSASASVPVVEKWLDGLPAANADVKAVMTDFESAKAAIAELENRITGKSTAPAKTETPKTETPKTETPKNDVPKNAAPKTSSPAEKPAEKMKSEAPASATVKLGYQQVDLLKGAKFNLRAVEGAAAAVKKSVGEMSAVKDPMSIDFRNVKKAINTLTEATRKSGFVNDSLKQLPANGDGVAEVVARLNTVSSEIASANKFLQPLDKELSAIIDPKNYPNLETDVRRLRDLSSMFANTSMFRDDRAQAAKMLVEIEPATAEVTRIATVYRRLMEQKTEPGKMIEIAGNSFLGRKQAYIAAADQAKQALPNQIRKDLGDVNRIANDAVENKKPMFFSGGIPQTMGFVDDKLELFKALDPANAKAIQAEVDQVKSAIKEKQKSLSALIIAQNPLPSDRFQEADRKKAIEVAIDAWKYQQKEFKVLTTRIPTEKWNRQKMWQYSNGTWYYIDQSRIQVQLIVADKEDAKLAIIRPVNIIKDHQKGDSMIGTPYYNIKDELMPNAYLMRDKIK